MREFADGRFLKYSEDPETAQKQHRAVNLILVNTSGCKQRLADLIADQRLHFPTADCCDEEFFAQRTAESATPTFNPAGVRVGRSG